jgi:hypothetical protein
MLLSASFSTVPSKLSKRYRYLLVYRYRYTVHFVISVPSIAPGLLELETKSAYKREEELKVSTEIAVHFNLRNQCLLLRLRPAPAPGKMCEAAATPGKKKLCSLRNYKSKELFTRNNYYQKGWGYFLLLIICY